MQVKLVMDCSTDGWNASATFYDAKDGTEIMEVTFDLGYQPCDGAEPCVQIETHPNFDREHLDMIRQAQLVVYAASAVDYGLKHGGPKERLIEMPGLNLMPAPSTAG
jgi:hypothetical protein